MNRSIVLAGALLLASASAFRLPAAEHAPTARDHYYEAALNDSGEEPAWRAVRTSILLRREGRDLREVSERADFRNSDSFKLIVESNMDGYLYLFLHDTEGHLKLLFPYEGGKGKTNQVVAFESRLVPGKTAPWFRFDNHSGAEQVFLFLSAKPISELENMKKGTDSEMLADLERLISHNGTPDFLQFDEGEANGVESVGSQSATYYAEKNAGARRFLVRRMELKHHSAE
jgi:hypothetical protein